MTTLVLFFYLYHNYLDKVEKVRLENPTNFIQISVFMTDLFIEIYLYIMKFFLRILANIWTMFRQHVWLA